MQSVKQPIMKINRCFLSAMDKAMKISIGLNQKGALLVIWYKH